MLILARRVGHLGPTEGRIDWVTMTTRCYNDQTNPVRQTTSVSQTNPGRRTGFSVGLARWGLAVCAAGVLFACSDGSRLRGFEPLAALVAIQPEGESVASVRMHQLPSGHKFSLHAVVRAQRDGEIVYFTDAPALEIEGNTLTAPQVRPWPDSRTTRVRWFTIEGSPPFIEWEKGRRFPRHQVVFRPDWGSGWRIPGDVRPGNSNLAFGAEGFGPTSFGTARYYVRVETYARGNRLAPEARFESPSLVAGEFEIDPAVPGVVINLAAPLTVPSQVFGLAQVEGLPPEPQILKEFQIQAKNRMTFSSAWVLNGFLSSIGHNWEDLEWSPLDLSGEERQVPWGTEVNPGDLLRAGGRVVFVFQDVSQARSTDQGLEPAKPGVVDYGDLCLDFSRGASVRRLDEVFSGGGQVEWARVAQR